MNIRKFSNKILGRIPTKSIEQLAMKSKVALLTVKFLTLQRDKTETVLEVLSSQKRRKTTFLLALWSLPLSILGFFGIANDDFFNEIISNELRCRFFFAFQFAQTFSSLLFFSEVPILAFLFRCATPHFRLFYISLLY